MENSSNPLTKYRSLTNILFQPLHNILVVNLIIGLEAEIVANSHWNEDHKQDFSAKAYCVSAVSMLLHFWSRGTISEL